MKCMAAVAKANLHSSRLLSGELDVIFVGMSNVGKSYQAKKLATPEKNTPLFEKICVDDQIEVALTSRMQKDGKYTSGIDGVAAWMGSPHAEDVSTRERYVEREKQYLKLESESYQALTMLATSSALAIDTTGSFVHCPRTVQRQVAKRGVVVYIEAAQQDVDDMLSSYVTHPKPVCWAGQYHEEPNESVAVAVKRSYLELLQWRAQRYRAIADVVIPKHDVWQTKNANELLDLISIQLD